MKLLELYLSPLDNPTEFKVIVTQSPAGEGESKSSLPFLDAERDWRITVIRSLEVSSFNSEFFSAGGEQEWMEKAGLLGSDRSTFHPNYLVNIGQALYNSLFPPGSRVEKLLKQSISLAESEFTLLVVRLKLEADVVQKMRLADYPWELLHNGHFLSHRQVEFSRYIAYPAVPPNLQTADKLNVLLVSSGASDEKLDLQPLSKKEQKAVGKGLKTASDKGDISQKQLEKATFAELRTYLTEHRGEQAPHVLHFDGHGLFGKRCRECGTMNSGPVVERCRNCNAELPSPQGYLVFEDEDGDADYISVEELGNQLHQSGLSDGDNQTGGVVLVVLSACQSGMTIVGKSVFNGAAQNLIAHQVPAVVAMQYSVRVDSATKFTEQFYRSLGQKNSLAVAVSQGRAAMGVEGNQWYRPVLYLRWQDNEGGQLFGSSTVPQSIPQNLPRSGVTKLVGREEDLENLHQLQEKEPVVISSINKSPEKEQKTPKLDPISSQKIFKLPETSPIVNFKGRTEQIKEIEKKLIENQNTQKTRIIYLVGKAGIGKSTLAYHFAKKYKEDKEHFKDGIIGTKYTIEEVTADSIAFKIISTLGQKIELDEDNLYDGKITSLIKDNFYDKEFLIILDNINQNHDQSIINFFRDLFKNKKNKCTVIVTTRDKNLSERVEQYVRVKNTSTTIEIPKLEANESLEILGELMGSKDFKPREKTFVEKIIKIVDHLPLALRISGCTLGDYKKHYKDNFYYEMLEKYVSSLLDEKKRLELDRSARGFRESDKRIDWSVEASLELSYKLLSEAQRNFFVSLAIFAEEGFFLKAVIAINNDNPNYSSDDDLKHSAVLERLSSLSLVDKKDQDNEAYILHSLIYSFALKKLQEYPKQEQLRKKHAQFFMGKVKQFDNNKTYDELEELKNYKSNIIKALKWLVKKKEQELREKPKTFKPKFQYILLREFPTFLGFLRSNTLPENHEDWKEIAEGLNCFFERELDGKEAEKALSIVRRLAIKIEYWQLYIDCCLRAAKFSCFNSKIYYASRRLKAAKIVINNRLHSKKERQKYLIKWYMRTGILLGRAIAIESRKTIKTLIKLFHKQDFGRSLIGINHKRFGPSQVEIVQKSLSNAVNQSRKLDNNNEKLLQKALFSRGNSVFVLLSRKELIAQKINIQTTIDLAIQDYQECIRSKDINNLYFRSIVCLYGLLKLREKNEEAQDYLDHTYKLCYSKSLKQQLSRELGYSAKKFQMLCKMLGKLDLLVNLYEYKIKVNKSIPDNRMVAIISIQIGGLLINENMIAEEKYRDKALECLKQTYKLRNYLEDKEPLVGTLRSFSVSASDKYSDVDRAIEAAKITIDIYRDNDDWKNLAKALNSKGLLYDKIGRVEEAITAFIEQSLIGDKYKDKLQLGGFSNSGFVTLLKNHPDFLFNNNDVFLNSFESILKNKKYSQDIIFLIKRLHSLSYYLKNYHYNDNDLANIAIKIIESANQISKVKKKHQLLAKGLYDLAKLQFETYKMRSGIKSFEKLYPMYKISSIDKTQFIRWLLQLGKLLKSLKNFEDAKTILEHQIEVSKFLDNHYFIHGLKVLVGLFIKQNKLKQAYDTFFKEAKVVVKYAKSSSYISPIIKNLIILGHRLRKKNELKFSTRVIQYVIKLSQDSEDRKSLAIGYNILGQVKWYKKEQEHAARLFVEQIKIGQEISDDEQIKIGTRDLVKIIGRLNQPNLRLLEDILMVLRENKEIIKNDRYLLDNLIALGEKVKATNQVKALEIFELSADFYTISRKIKNFSKLKTQIKDLSKELVSDKYYKDASKALLLLFSLDKTFDKQELAERLINVGQKLESQNYLTDAQELFECVIKIGQDTNDMINESLGYSFLGKILQAKGLLSDAFLAFLCQIKICELPEFRKMPEEPIKIWDQQNNRDKEKKSTEFLKDGLESLKELLPLQYNRAIESLKNLCEIADNEPPHVKLSSFREQLSDGFEAFYILFQIDNILYSRSIVNGDFYESLRKFIKDRAEKWDSDKYYLNKSISLAENVQQKGLEKDAFYIVGKIFSMTKRPDNLAIDYLNKAIEHSQIENCELKYLAQIYQARGMISVLQQNYKAALKDFDQSFNIAEKSGDILGLELIINNLEKTLKRKDIDQENKAIIYCKRSLAVAPGSFVLQEIYKKYSNDKLTILPKQVKSQNKQHQKLNNYFKYVEEYEKYVEKNEKDKYRNTNENIWVPRICHQNNWVLSVWVYRYTKNSFEIGLFLAADCFLFRKDAGVIAALMYCLSDAYFYTGKMQLTFCGQKEDKNYQLEKGFEPKIPESIVRVSKELEVTIEEDGKLISDEQGREFYIKITGWSPEIRETIREKKIDLVHISFLVNRGVWTHEQVELLTRYSQELNCIFNGRMSRESFIIYQHNLLLLRFGLMAEYFKNTLNGYNEMRRDPLEIKWFDINKQEYFTTHALEITTIFQGNYTIPKNTKFQVIYLCHNQENYESFVDRDFQVFTSENLTIFVVTRDFDWISRTTTNFVRDFVNKNTKNTKVFIVKILNILGELNREVHERLSRTSNSHKYLSERPE